MHNGYVNPHEDPYDDRGYKPGFTRDDPRVGVYHDHRIDWRKQNPLPVDLVNYCHIDHPMYILTIPDSRLSVDASRGYPKALDLPSMLAAENEGREKLLAFMSEHGIVADSAPAWYLSSYWG